VGLEALGVQVQVAPALRHEAPVTVEPDAAPTPPVVALVGCGSAKRPVRSKARDLYTGALFEATLAYALTLTPHTLIVSARHGLLDLDTEIAPYDFTIADLGGKRERVAWGERIVNAVEGRFRQQLPAVTLLMGDTYAQYLRGNIAFRAGEYYAGARWPCKAHEPLAGIQPIGRRIVALREMTAALVARRAANPPLAP
jgi:hypothetical protein